ncbi:MAG TPA: hypothetical protein VNE39_01360 [Planctomycetota bacterium]|nr:hypothetical protein [Planctomycetota bacterium]
MEQPCQPNDRASTTEDGAKRPQVIAAQDGAWAEEPSPDLQPQFRCIRRSRGTRLPMP